MVRKKTSLSRVSYKVCRAGACTAEGKLVKRAGEAELVVEAEEEWLVDRAFRMS